MKKYYYHIVILALFLLPSTLMAVGASANFISFWTTAGLGTTTKRLTITPSGGLLLASNSSDITDGIIASGSEAIATGCLSVVNGRLRFSTNAAWYNVVLASDTVPGTTTTVTMPYEYGVSSWSMNIREGIITGVSTP